ncbi:MAG TPA: flagellar motor protein MotB [Bauldia sp.]|nr:flagellar motor protein MotB [Bauldia sp.]
MSEARHEELIIVRRHEEDEHEHHSSAWKVAHADFMTAMMAFFLIMWLISVTDDQVRKGISEYFNPIHLSTGSSAMKGLNMPDPGAKAAGTKGHTDVGVSPPEFNPMKLSTGQADTKSLAEKAAAEAVAAAKAAAEKAAAEKAAGKGAAPLPTNDPSDGIAPAAGADDLGGRLSGRAGAARERAVFENPYGVLSELAEKFALDHPGDLAATPGDTRPEGLPAGAADRDPFDPVYWQLSPVPTARTDTPGPDGTAPPTPTGKPDALGPVDATEGLNGAVTLERLDGTPVVVPPPAAKPAPVTPLAKVETGDKPKDMAAAPVTEPKPDATVEAEAGAIESDIVKSLKATMGKEAAPFVSVAVTKEGILIDLTDDADFSMFEVGSAVPNEKVVVLMQEVGRSLAKIPGDVVVRGFTDGRPFKSELYDNWRLSAARAQMAHYMLTRGGLPDSRIVRIEGYADRALKVPADPLAAENRRIEILLERRAP